MKKISLNGTWSLRGHNTSTVSAKDISINATVPGMVQLDLSENGYLPRDLYMGKNILETEKYETYEWIYERTFTLEEISPRAYLVFRGVDCVAEYFLNGEKLGESDNMFIPFEFEVSHKLRKGENTLAVHIFSPIVKAHEKETDLYSIANYWNTSPDTRLRRAAHTYGWDIMPRAVTSGIWREVYLEFRDEVSFRQASFDFRNTGWSAFFYELECSYADINDIEIEVEAACGESHFIAKGRPRQKNYGAVRFSVPSPKLWWPYGYGEPNLYDAEARIYLRGELVHTRRMRVGIRTVELERTISTDGINGYFRFIINGVEVMAKGSNWVPLDAFHSRDKERYADALALVKDIGCNILRCWGGNVYEDHEFFDFCDENGIMVWQDFAMACGAYPQDDEFATSLYREAVSVIREFRGHPSIILWSGDNEVDIMLKGQGTLPSTNRLTREVLKDAVKQNDRGRPYLESSPYLDDSMVKERALSLPEDHLWGPRDYYKADFYKQNKSHFVSETGYHGCPDIESVKRFISPDKVWHYRDNDEWRLHSTDRYGDYDRVMLMDKQVRQLFGEVPEDPHTYALASQISQAEADKYFIERIRVGRPYKSGIIWWNLLDGWPQMSDAVVDYYFVKKLAYRYIKRSQAPFTVAADEMRSWGLPIYLCNDTLTEKRGRLRIWDADTEETLSELDFAASPNSSRKIVKLPLFYSEKRLLVFDWTLSDGECGRNHYLTGYPPFPLEKYLSWIEKGIL